MSQQQQLNAAEEEDDDAWMTSEDSNNSHMTATPLLFLLDGCLSQDEDRVEEALQEIQEAMRGMPLPPLGASPCVCPNTLCTVLTALLAVRPDFCRLASEHDGSLPLHFAASLGIVQVASIIFQKVRYVFCDLFCCLHNCSYTMVQRDDE